MSKPEKTHDLYLKVPQPDGSLNHYEVGNLMVAPPTIGIRLTKVLKNAIANQEEGTWLNLTARCPREGRSR